MNSNAMQTNLPNGYNQNAWKACVDMAIAQKAWGQKIVKDKQWEARACEESKKMSRGFADKPLHEMVEYLYGYSKMRNEIGEKSNCPCAFASEMQAWKQMTETGVHPDLGVWVTP